MSSLPEPSLADNYQGSTKVLLWTDGSILWGDCFWLTCGGCATVNDQEECIFPSPVQHWNLNSYTVDFFAIAVAFLKTENPVDIFSDCKTLVAHFNITLLGNGVSGDWPLFAW